MKNFHSLKDPALVVVGFIGELHEPGSVGVGIGHRSVGHFEALGGGRLRSEPDEMTATRPRRPRRKSEVYFSVTRNSQHPIPPMEGTRNESLLLERMKIKK